MKHTRLVVRLTGLGEAQAEGVAAVPALVLLAFGAALMVALGLKDMAVTHCCKARLNASTEPLS